MCQNRIRIVRLPSSFPHQRLSNHVPEIRRLCKGCSGFRCFGAVLGVLAWFSWEEGGQEGVCVCACVVVFQTIKSARVSVQACAHVQIIQSLRKASYVFPCSNRSLASDTAASTTSDVISQPLCEEKGSVVHPCLLNPCNVVALLVTKSDIVKTARIIHSAQRTFTRCAWFPTLAW